jgi:deazaflavin-dependent oxidoreductase (nitroreductase family)
MKRRNPAIRFLRLLLTIPIVLAAAVMASYLFLLGWGMLMRVRWVSDRTRQLTKRGNRYLRRIAGTRMGMLYFNLGVLHHIGRRSGRPYMTPLSAYPFGDGFVLAAAYPHVDWCENVLAAGKCTLTWNRKEYALERPEVIPRTAAILAYPLLVKPFLAGGAGQNKFVWLHRAGPQEGQKVDIGAGKRVHD